MPTSSRPRSRQLRSTVAPDLFAHFDQRAFPGSSLPALSLAAEAYARDVHLGERVSLLLRDALFEEGRDISRPDELVRVADLAGVTSVAASTDGAQLVVADWDEGRRRGVIGSPHFFIGEAGFFCPSLDIRHVDGEMQIAFDEAPFEGFMRQVSAAADRSPLPAR